MSSSDYLRRKVEDKYYMETVKADVKRDKALKDAADSGDDTSYLRERANVGAAIDKEIARRQKKSDKALIRKHGKRAARARGFMTDYIKNYTNPPRKPKADLK